MNEKISFDIHPSNKLKLKDIAKKENISLSVLVSTIVKDYLEINNATKTQPVNITENATNTQYDASALQRIEDKLDYLLVQDKKPNMKKDIYSKIINCVKANKQHIGVVALVELMDIIPELRPAKR